MDCVSSEALDWALTHIEKFGDTDIFPVDFEFRAMRHCWTWLRGEMEKLDLDKHSPRAYRRMVVPKPGGGFRAAVQLDPLDALVYTALIYEEAERIEKYRVPASRRVACSFRVGLDPHGGFFAPGDGRSDFYARSQELADSGKYSHVLLGDIADFYNQIYLHRVENALESATVPTQRAKNVERFLMELNGMQSRGLPVGPLASTLLAEACLNDVDMFLLGKGCPHVRYVDDFRIFCRSRREAITIQHDLTEYLLTSHRLSLESSKTRVMGMRKFRTSKLQDPAQEEKKAKVAKLEELIEQFRVVTGYSVGADDLAPQARSSAVRKSLADLFDECVNAKPLHLGLARLRRARRLRTAVLIPRTFENLEMLTPAFRDTAGYISTCLPRREEKTRGKELISFLEDNDFGALPFVRAWGLEIMDERPDMVARDAAIELAEGSSTALGARPMALVARRNKQVEWVRQQKDTWKNHGPWDRRAIIWSSSVLPKDERRHWLKLVEKDAEPLERAVAQLAASQT